MIKEGKQSFIYDEEWNQIMASTKKKEEKPVGNNVNLKYIKKARILIC